MKLSEIKKQLRQLQEIAFKLPNGSLVPTHFHVTEIGKITKNFIDCGGNIRKEEVINFQLWEANDYEHKLHPEKLIHIIEFAEKSLKLEDLEVEIEYQSSSTIEKYQLEFNGEIFLLTNILTNCLAKDACGVPKEEQPVCSPNSNCC